MTISYDFDICRAEPVGAAAGSSATFVALWRDPDTAEALKRSPKWLQDLFVQSRFGLEASGRNTPPGTYLAEEEAARDRIIEELAARVVDKMPDLQGKGGLPESPFDLKEFVESLETARVADELDFEAQELAEHMQEPAQEDAAGRSTSALVRQVVLGAIVCYAVGIAGSVIGTPLLSTASAVLASNHE